MPKEVTPRPGRPAAKSASGDVADFLAKVARTPNLKASGTRGRLIFAMDATASREPTWDRACHLQAEMFNATDGLGGLEVQLVFFRGFGECKVSPWVQSSGDLVRRMTAVRCRGGQTQIEKVLKHALKEHQRSGVNALVYVGDCTEEDVDRLCHHAGHLGVRGVPAFVFQEGVEPIAMRAFRQIAKLSGGAYCSFDSASARQLRELLSAVAVFAAGGRLALADYGKRTGGAALQITKQIG